MVKIKITAGIFYWQNNIVRAGDPAIEVDEATARRLVEEKGVAEYVTPSADTNTGEERTAEEPDGKAYHIGMTAKELREIGASYGLTFKQGMSKAQMVEKMDSLFADLAPAETEQGAEPDAEDAPTFDAAEAVQ